MRAQDDHSLERMSRCITLSVGLAMLALLSGVPGGSPSAAVVADLYETEVRVPTQQPEDRERALGLALRRVLLKVSGRRDIESQEMLVAALDEPGRFVQQFRYRGGEDGEPEATGGGGPFRLWARFDAELVDALVRDAGLPVWGRLRPSTLVWFSVESEGTRTLLATDRDAVPFVPLEEAARRRGIPLVLPLLDLEDRLAVDPDEIWAGFFDRLRQASARYGTEAVLLIRLRALLPSLSEAQWSLLMEGSEQHWTTQSDAIELLLEDGVHIAADHLAARYSRSADAFATGTVEIVVTAVRTLADYARALRYLSSLDEVEWIAVEAVEAGQVRFRVDAHGGRSSLRQSVALGATLSPEGHAAQDGVLTMRLLP